MAPGVNKLPDFSKGEEVNHRPPSEFQPLFGQASDQQIWIDEPPAANDDSVDDLAAMVSQLGQLPVEPIEEASRDLAGFEAGGIETADASMSSSPPPSPPPPVAQDGVSAEAHEAAIEALQQQHAQELERVHGEHNEQVMQHLEAVQNGLMVGVADQIERHLAEALTPLFQNDISRTSLDQLLTEIKRIVQNEAVERISLSGPEALVSAASKALAGSAVAIDVEPSDSPDLVVHLNQKILSTGIEDWVRKIEEALGE